MSHLIPPSRAAATTHGPVRLPLRYADTTVVQAFYWLDAERADAALRATGTIAARFDGRALAGLALYDYGASTIGPYRECAVAVVGVPRGGPAPRWSWFDQLRRSDRRASGFTVLQLPVTCEAARSAGVELWGYPKFVTAIEVSLAGGRVRATVADPDGGPPLLSVEGVLGGGLRLPLLDYVSHSRRGDDMLRTMVSVRGRGRTGRGKRMVVQIGDTGRPFTDTLAALGLGERRPFLWQAASGVRTVLHEGVRLAPHHLHGERR